MGNMAGLEGKQLGDCEILAKLGQGGMGAVYKARQTALDRFVAIKVLPPQFCGDEEFLARFKREAAAAARLTHPNIVQVHSAGVQDETHFFVMEFVDGESVQHRLQRKGRIDPEEALAICIHVALGLDYAWRRSQLIHRDIKPDNIFLSKDAEVKLGDLGLAKSAGGPSSGLTMTGAYMGTPYFVSPEQAQGLKEIDFRADIYSLGCTLYYMVSGHMPYESEGSNALQVILKHVNEPPPDILQVWPACPVPLAELIATMIQKKPEDRYQSYADLIADMRSVVAELKAEAAPRAAPPQKSAKQSAAPPPTPPKKDATPGAPPSFAKIMGLTGVVSLVVIGAAIYWGASCGKSKQAAQAAATPPATIAGAETLEPGAIRLWDSPDKIPKKTQYAIRWENSVLVLGDGTNCGMLIYSAPKSRDAIIRAEVRMAPGAHPWIGLRINPGEPDYRICVATGQQHVSLTCTDKGFGQELNRWPLPRAYGTNEWARVELRAMGDELTVLADGHILGSVRDRRQLNAGGAFVFHQPKASGYFRNIVYVPLDKPGGGGATSPAAAGGVDDAFIKEVAVLQTPQQVARVMAKLKELNPDFDPAAANERHAGAGGVVVGLDFSALGLNDISPLRALPDLKRLNCCGMGGKNHSSPLEDLSPLRGMHLEVFHCDWTSVKDLAPLAGMPLKALGVGGTRVEDLSAVQGMSLTSLTCQCTAIVDLSPLRGMRLEALNCTFCKIRDFSPLAGMPLKTLLCKHERITDRDLTPIRDLPIETLGLNFNAARDTAILRAMKSLKTINDLPAAEFWKQVEASQTPGAPLPTAADETLEPGAIRLFRSPDELPKRAGVSWEDGVLRLDQASAIMKCSNRDAIIRADIRMNRDADSPQVCLRHRKSSADSVEYFYRLSIKRVEDSLVLSVPREGKNVILQSWPLPRAYQTDEWARVELRVIGDEVTATLDGKTVGTVHDTSQPYAGSPMLFALAKGFFRNVVYIPLDKPGGGGPR